MAELTVQEVTESGLEPTFASATAGGDTFKNDTGERTFLVAKNGSASEMTVTVTAQVPSKSVAGFGSLTKSDVSVAIPASEERWIGPFPGTAFNNATGLVSVTYSDETSVTVAAIKVPAQ